VYSLDILLFHVVYGNGTEWEYHSAKWEEMGMKCKNQDITGMGTSPWKWKEAGIPKAIPTHL